MSYKSLIYEKKDKVARITLNRPEVLNAIDGNLHREWLMALDEAEQDEEVRVVVIAGAGRAFSTGHDLKQDLTDPLTGPEAWRAAFKSSMDLALKIWDLDKPVIAAVNGYCLGKAYQVVQACDIIIASEQAIFGEPEVRFVAGSTFPILTWVIGLRKAKELMLTGDTIDGREAERIGLVNKTVPHHQLEQEVDRFARKLAGIPPAAIRLNKRTINRNLEIAGLRAAVAYNLEYLSAIASIVAEKGERADFMKMAHERGLKAALRFRDAPPGEA